MNEEEAKQVIPKGLYCYSRDAAGQRVPCQFWSAKELGGEPGAHCSYLKVDSERWNTRNLIWDAVKECQINEDRENESVS